MEYSGKYIPPGNKLDALIAEHVMGWRIGGKTWGQRRFLTNNGRYLFEDNDHGRLPLKRIPRFSASADSAFEIAAYDYALLDFAHAMEFESFDKQHSVCVMREDYQFPGVIEEARDIWARRAMFAHGRSLIALAITGYNIIPEEKSGS